MAARIHSFSRAHRPLLTPASSVVASRARSRAASGYHRLPTPKRALVPHAASVRGESGQRSSGVAPAQPRLAVLLEARRREERIEEVPVTRVYEPGNPTSHFRPIQDSARIYAPLLRYMGTRGLRQARKLLRGHGLKRAHDHKESQ